MPAVARVLHARRRQERAARTPACLPVPARQAATPVGHLRKALCGTAAQDPPDTRGHAARSTLPTPLGSLLKRSSARAVAGDTSALEILRSYCMV